VFLPFLYNFVYRNYFNLYLLVLEDIFTFYVVLMKKSWLIGLLSPCIAFAGYFDSDDYEQWDNEERYSQEEVCEHCGAALEDREEIAARDDYDSQERRVSPQRKRSSAYLGSNSRSRHPREKADSDRPKVVQRRSNSQQKNQYENSYREEARAEGKSGKREGSSSATIGSLSRKSKPSRDPEESSSNKKGVRAGKFKRKNTVSRDEDLHSSQRKFSSSKASKNHTRSAPEKQHRNRARSQKGEREQMERQDLRGKHKNYSIH